MVHCHAVDVGSSFSPVSVRVERRKTSKSWKMKMVMEKSLNMKNWPKVMEFYDQSWNFTNFNPELYQICMSFATTKKLSIDVESLIFQRVFRKT